MEKYFKQVAVLNKKDNVGIEFMMCKLGEECGELFQSVNKMIGRKSTNQTQKQIKNHIAEECVDTIQNVFAVAEKSGITYKQLCAMFGKKNTKWRTKITKKSGGVTKAETTKLKAKVNKTIPTFNE